jgi:hypothetical protein
MTTKTTKILLVLNLLVLGGILVRQSVASQSFAMQSSAQSAVKDNEELTRMYQEDRSDRALPAKSIDWSVVGPRDKARLARVKELYIQNKLQTGGDYYHAGMILQHGDVPEDYLLAHELCVVAISKGSIDARALAAKSEDRFLMSIDRSQRFGTQFLSEGPNAPFKLYKMDSGVTDELRRTMDIPSLAAAKARESEMNRNK